MVVCHVERRTYVVCSRVRCWGSAWFSEGRSDRRLEKIAWWGASSQISFV